MYIYSPIFACQSQGENKQTFLALNPNTENQMISPRSILFLLTDNERQEILGVPTDGLETHTNHVLLFVGYEEERSQKPILKIVIPAFINLKLDPGLVPDLNGLQAGQYFWVDFRADGGGNRVTNDGIERDISSMATAVINVFNDRLVALARSLRIFYECLPNAGEFESFVKHVAEGKTSIDTFSEAFPPEFVELGMEIAKAAAKTMLPKMSRDIQKAFVPKFNLWEETLRAQLHPTAVQNP